MEKPKEPGTLINNLDHRACGRLDRTPARPGKGTAWGPVGTWVDPTTSWDETKNPDNPFGPAMILVDGTDSRHIHGTTGPLKGGLPYIGGRAPNDRRFNHGCAGLTNESIIELKRDVGETLKSGRNIPVHFR